MDCLVPTSVGVRCNKCKAAHRVRYHSNREANVKRAQQRRQRLKRAAFDAYGGPKCMCCGEEHLEFLTIDHVEGGGAEHRRKLVADKGWKDSRSMGGSHMYLWLKQQDYPDGYRVLCFNCNFALGHFGYCPHRTE